MAIPLLPNRPANILLAASKSPSPIIGNDRHPAHHSSIRKTRTSRPKVRTGCLTCKTRRVKCDESKPECQRCIRTGRKCDGYVETKAQQQRHRKSEAAMALLLCKTPTSYYGTPAETRALEFFYLNTAPQLASYFDADFWTRLIFQMNHAEVAIRHAMVALGTLSEHQADKPQRMPFNAGRVQKGMTDKFPNPTNMTLPLIKPDVENEATFALLHYNKSIKELAARVEKADVPIETVLLACILFVCVEFMRGDVQPALKHFESGMRVAVTSLAETSTISGLAAERIKQNMLPFFNRLELLSKVLGHNYDWEYATPLSEAVPENFANIREARNSLVHLSNISIRFIRANGLRRYQNLDFTLEREEQYTLLASLDTWKHKFDDLVLSETFSASDLNGAKVLRIWQITASAWINGALRCDECKHDHLNEQWELVVSLAEAIQGSSEKTPGQRHGYTFLFDMEIVSHLWLVITKCRHPVIRRRASTILKTTARREGLYDAQLAGAIADRLMAIEEKNLSVLDGSQLPAECDRVHHTTITHTASELGVDTYLLTYYYRPHGLDGPPEAMYEEVQLAQDSNF